MVYDFVAKIKNVQDIELLTDEALAALISKINANHDTFLELRFILPEANMSGDVLVKSSSSVSSMPALHDSELETTISAFKSYLEDIAAEIDGEISKQDGFYNNTKTFKRLFN